MKKKLGQFLKDTMLGVIGLIVMNAVLSLIVYPYLGRELGLETQGQILFYTSVTGLLAGTFGSAANYIRLKVFSKERKTVNGDYNLFLAFSALLVIALLVGLFILKGDTAGVSWYGILVLALATTVRYYADVEFRLTLRYGHFSMYYVSIGIGYLMGLFLFRLFPSWVLILLAGELFGLLYVLIFGKVLKYEVFTRSSNYRRHFGMMASLALAYLLSDFIGLADRLLFPFILENGDELTSLYYQASLVGKMMSLLSMPLNGVLMGHLSNEEGEISRKNFLKILGILIALFALVLAVSVLGSHIFVLWRYPDSYEAVKDLFLLANAGQVLFFISGTLTVIVLRYTKLRNQIITSVITVAAFFAVTVPFIRSFGLHGMAYGILLVNLLRFLVLSVLGLIGLKKKASR